MIFIIVDQKYLYLFMSMAKIPKFGAKIFLVECSHLNLTKVNIPKFVECIKVNQFHK